MGGGHLIMVGPWGLAVSCCQAETLCRKCTCVNQVVFSDTLQAAGSRCTSVLLLQCFVPVNKGSFYFHVQQWKAFNSWGSDVLNSMAASSYSMYNKVQAYLFSIVCSYLSLVEAGFWNGAGTLLAKQAKQTRRSLFVLQQKGKGASGYKSGYGLYF